MAVTQNYAMQLLGSYFEHIHIVDERVGADTRIEEEASRVLTGLNPD
jgi:hypothetical protein